MYSCTSRSIATCNARRAPSRRMSSRAGAVASRSCNPLESMRRILSVPRGTLVNRTSRFTEGTPLLFSRQSSTTFGYSSDRRAARVSCDPYRRRVLASSPPRGDCPQRAGKPNPSSTNFFLRASDRRIHSAHSIHHAGVLMSGHGVGRRHLVAWIIVSPVWAAAAAAAPASPGAAKFGSKPQPARVPLLRQGSVSGPAGVGTERPLLRVPGGGVWGFLPRSTESLYKLRPESVRSPVPQRSPSDTADSTSGVVLDNTFGPRRVLEPVGGVLTIGSDDGRSAGPNLFYSFDRFNLVGGETARFLPPA